jgi:predicted RNase H-like nuclease (RuvC/YqgF family)
LLIKRVVELATPSHSYHPDSANLQERCIRTEADNAALQATVSTLRSDKQSLVEELESSKESLIAAQRKTDRLRMELDKSKRERGGSMTKSDEHTHGNGVITKGQEALKSESSGVAKMEVDSRPGTPNGHVNDVNPATAAGATVRAFNAGTHEQEGDVAWLRECLAAKQKEIDELRGRLKEYAEEMDFLRTCVGTA